MTPYGWARAPRGQRFVRGFSRLLLRTQVRHVEVTNAQRMPAEGPVLVVANHFSSLVDPIAILDASPRPVVFLAKAPLWRSPLLRPFLDASRAVPVYRPEDMAENEGRGARANAKTFEEVHERLTRGEVVALFPEGTSQAQPRLMPLRTGAARIALGLGGPVAILPVGLDCLAGERETRGRILVRFGEPFVVDASLPEGQGRRAIVGVTRRIETALRALLAEAPSRADAAALRTLRILWDQEKGVPRPRTLEEDLQRTQRFARALAYLRERDPALLDTVRAEADAYARALASVGTPAHLLEARWTGLGALRVLSRDLPLLLLAAPLALLAGIVTWPARQLGDLLALRTFGGTEDVRALCRMTGAAVILGLLMAVGALLGWVLAGWTWALAALVAPPLLLGFYVTWNDRRHDVRTRLRSWLLLAGRSPLRQSLRRQRRRVYERLLSIQVRLREAERTAHGTSVPPGTGAAVGPVSRADAR